MAFGKLYLVPNLLGATQPEKVLPAGTLDVVRKLRHFVVENTRTSRRVLSRIGMDCPIDDIEFIATKVLRNGQVVIMRDGKAFNVLGAEL